MDAANRLNNSKIKNKTKVLFSANLGFLYKEMSFLEGIKAAKQDGFDGIECHWPYNTPSEKVHNVLKETGLPIIGINTNPGNLKKGFFGFSALPQYTKKAKYEINMSIKYGINIGIKNLHVMAGNIPKTKYAQKTFCDNLRYACNLANKHKINILIEPLNSKDHPNYYLSSLEQAIEVLLEVDLPNLKIMFDFYHIHHMKSEVLVLFKKVKKYIGHIQIASVPNRNEPSNYEFEFLRNILEDKTIESPLWVGAEYKPKTGFVRDGISWINSFKELS